MTTKAKAKTAKTKTEKAVELFNPNNIELAITGSITKNNLPAMKEAWTEWLNQQDATTLATDKDFAAAADFIKSCKQTEDILTDIEEKAVKGDIKKVLQDIREMREATRQKRLEFSRMVETRKTTLKSNAVEAAVKKVTDYISTLPYRWTAVDNVDIVGRMRTAIKGLSAYLKMDEALEAEVTKLTAEASEYSAQFARNRAAVAELYTAAGETATESELDMMVRTYGDGAPERAKFILDQKKLARQQAELNKQKAPEPMPATEEAKPEPDHYGRTAKAVRFGATFLTDDIEATIRQIENIGGSDVKYIIK